jgi:hypothetical protein
LLLCIVVLLAIPLQVFAQSDVIVSAPDTVQGDSNHSVVMQQPPLRWHSMFTNIPGDWVRYGRTTFTVQNIPAILGMGALTAALIVSDDATYKASDRWYRSSNTVKETSDFFEYLGDGRPQFGLAGAFAIYGFVADDSRALRTASQVVEAIFACGVVVQVLKHTTGRESPLVSTEPGGVWRFFPNQIEYHKHVPHYDAYPSGHIATALATVTVVAENYPEWTWVRPVGYPIVALIGIAMANTGIHWYSDYPLGLALGYSFGMLASHPELVPVTNDVPVSVLPLVSPYGAGIAIRIDL